MPPAHRTGFSPANFSPWKITLRPSFCHAGIAHGLFCHSLVALAWATAQRKPPHPPACLPRPDLGTDSLPQPDYETVVQFLSGSSSLSSTAPPLCASLGAVCPPNELGRVSSENLAS